MKRTFINTAMLLLLAVFTFNAQVSAQTPAWTKTKATQWVKAGKWRNGFKLKVSPGADVVEFATQYHKNQATWDKVFDFLKTHDLQTIALGKYPIDDNAFVNVTNNVDRPLENTTWEAHRKYIDLQYIARGKEKMGMAPLAKTKIVKEYNETKDVCVPEATEAIAKYYVAEPSTFLLFFPKDAHRPNIKVDSDTVRKVVVKIKAL
ncbi:MAG: YhcH/YjgK/YiaL family protein [Bacteroidota bacterium]|nr:YhcH/YjgK/YiaL family protein [Bacteroidota bacterium]